MVEATKKAASGEAAGGRNVERKPVIATTNLLEDRAGPIRKSAGGETDTRYMLSERIGERARSRLMEMCATIRMHGIADYRDANHRQGTLIGG